jgi:hypothetical protein
MTTCSTGRRRRRPTAAGSGVMGASAATGET